MSDKGQILLHISEFFFNSMGPGHSKKVCIFSKYFEASSVTLVSIFGIPKRVMNFIV